jgi:F-type H+-transporting ATPase subunit delta
MADVQAAKRYAQAVFAIARESGAIAAWRSDLNDIASVLAESGLAPILADGKRPLTERQALIDQVLEIQPAAANLAKLLVQKARTGEARALADAFTAMADAEEGRAKAVVTTAVELSPEQLQAIEAELSRSVGKNVEAVTTVDPSIVGGLVVRLGDKLLDGSVRPRLQVLRRELQGAR